MVFGLNRTVACAGGAAENAGEEFIPLFFSRV